MPTLVGIPCLLVSDASFSGITVTGSILTIDHLQVPSTQTDFTVLIRFTDNRFKLIANGGKVANVNGYDIRPYSDIGLSSALTYELERYNGTTGEVVMWVKIPSVSSVSDTIFYLGYGNAALTTDGSSPTTWSNSFNSVYHMKDGTTLSVLDAVGNNNGTNNNGVTATTGQIDGGAGFASASSQSVTINVYNGTAFTFSAWIKGTTFPNAYNTVIMSQNIGVYKDLFVKSNGKLACFVFATNDRSYDGTGSHTLVTGTWYHVALSYNSTAGLVGYVNGASDGTAAANGNAGNSSTGAIGNDVVNAGRFWNGAMDEVRVATVARSADWIACEYNNQKDSQTFLTLGAEL